MDSNSNYRFVTSYGISDYFVNFMQRIEKENSTREKRKEFGKPR